MATALDIMQQIWKQENIWIEIKSKKTDLPRYKVQRRFPKNKKVIDFINSRFSDYDRSMIVVKKDNGTEVSDKATIEYLRSSYKNNTIKLIEATFIVALKDKKINKIKKIQDLAIIYTENIKNTNT